MSAEGLLLVGRYAAFAGMRVTLAVRMSLPVEGGQTESYVGTVVAVAKRIRSAVSGTQYDLVFTDADGLMRTVALSRIVECQPAPGEE